jgi:hypothetical protein
MNISWSTEGLAVGWSAWLDAFSVANLSVILLAAAFVGALIVSYFDARGREQRLVMRLELDQLARMLAAIWALISLGFFLLESAKLRLQIRILTRKFIKLSEENRRLVLKHREMLALNGGRTVLLNEPLDEIERIHASNENKLSHGSRERVFASNFYFLISHF